MKDLPVYVISLRDAYARRQKITERLAAVGLSFQFIDAYDAREGAIPDEFDGAKVLREGFFSDCAIGCALSHRMVHRTIAGGNSEQALVLEDDADLPPEFPEILSKASALRFDIFKFEGGPPGGLRRQIAVLGKIGAYRVIAGIQTSLGSAAYLIRKSAALRFCSFPVIDRAIDYQFSDPRLALRVLELDPHVVSQQSEDGGFSNAPPQYWPSLDASGSASRFGRFLKSVQRRGMLLRLYGLRASIEFEICKHTHKRRASRLV